MRIDREYGKRSEEDSLEPKIKCFIACEGRKTEYLVSVPAIRVIYAIA